VSRRRHDRPARAALRSEKPGAGGAARPPAAPAEPQVPVFELLPAFEEEGAPRFEPGPVARTLLDERSAPGEQCRLLGARLRALGRDKRLRRIGVVGSSPGEGTTTVALGLARALSVDRHLRVLLLELDLGRPALDDELGLDPPAVGLRQYLAGKGDVPVLRRSRPAGFWVLSAGAGAGSHERALASPRLAALLRAADRVFDFVVADCPPLLEGGGAGLSDHLDGFVFVVRSRRAERETIQRAAALLRPELIVGLVLNAQRDILGRRKP
jgi:Mrp family chromosome partitioning ATPase